MTTPPGDPEPTTLPPLECLSFYLDRLIEGEAWADTGREAARYILNMGWTHPEMGGAA